jgi:hypothetical protein
VTRSSALGASTSLVEVTNISTHGLWILVREREYFLPFDNYPWFRDATVRAITRVELLHESHLHWPDLDVDLELDSLDHPDRYPLVAR